MEIDEHVHRWQGGATITPMKLHAGRGTVGKTVVDGFKDLDTKQVCAKVVQGTDRDTLQGFDEDCVEPGARKFTDEHHAYQASGTT